MTRGIFARGLAFVTVLFIAGCAGNGGLETQMKQLRAELFSEIKSRNAELYEGFRKDISESEERSKKNFLDLESKTRKDMVSLSKTLQNELSEVKETHNKYSIETDKTLLDHQKQIFQNKGFLDDNARRVYMLETIVTTRNASVSPLMKEGYITFIDKKKVAFSLGAANGVKSGDKCLVYKNNENIGTIIIDAVERESSRGTILESRKDVSIGDKVELGKK
jgi:hypothetical protein